MTTPRQGRVRVGGVQPGQVLAGLVGAVYLAAGIIGFVVGGFGDFTGDAHLMWVFGVNPLHNVIHLVTGVLGLLMATSSALARTYGWLLFVAFGLLLVWGLAITGIFASNPVSHLGNPVALNAADNWAHVGTAAVGLLIAVMPARKIVEHGGPSPRGSSIDMVDTQPFRRPGVGGDTGDTGPRGDVPRRWRRDAAR